MVMSRGPDERTQMHAVSILLSTFESMSNRVLVDGAATWVLQGGGQEQRDKTAGVKAIFSVLASTTSGRAKELVKQSLSNRNGMVAFGSTRTFWPDRRCSEAHGCVPVPMGFHG